MQQVKILSHSYDKDEIKKKLEELILKGNEIQIIIPHEGYDVVIYRKLYTELF